MATTDAAVSTGSAMSSEGDAAAAPPVKRARTNPASDDAQLDMPSFEEWMMSWRRGTEEDDGSRTMLPAATDDEVAAFKTQIALEDERRRHDVDNAISSLSSEFAPLVSAAEVEAAKAGARLAELEGLQASDDAVFKLAQEFEVVKGCVQAAIESCSAYMAAKKYLLVRNSADVEPAVRQEAAELAKRSTEVERRFSEICVALDTIRRGAAERSELEARRLKEVKDAEVMERLFCRYDKDLDGRLNANEVRAFAVGECNFDIPQDKLLDILSSEPFASSGNVVTKEAFPRLRLEVGVASVAGALQGVESEVANAETLARPLSARGPAAVPLRQLPDATDALDMAIDVAKDYLGAARDQVEGLAVDDATSGDVAPEAAALGSRLERLEVRLAQAQSVAKYCRDRFELQRKKAALIRELG